MSDPNGDTPVYLGYPDAQSREDAYDYIENFNPDLFNEPSTSVSANNDESANDSNVEELLCTQPPRDLAVDYIDNFNEDLFAEPMEVDQPDVRASNGDLEHEEYPQALTIIEKAKARLRKYALNTHRLTCKINPVPEGVDSKNWVEAAFRQLYSEIVAAGGRGMNRVCMTFKFDSMQNDVAWVSPRAIDGYEYEDLWNLVSSIAQSANGFDCAETFTIQLHVAEAPVGQGLTDKQKLRSKMAGKSLITIANNDNLCFPRSLVVAMTYIRFEKNKSLEEKKVKSKEWERIRKPESVYQREKAKILTEKSGVSIPEAGCGLEEIIMYQRCLAEEGWVIIVYFTRKIGREHKILYNGRNEVTSRNIPVRDTIRIAYHENLNHYEPIKNTSSFFGYKKHCQDCDKLCKSDTHRCIKKCVKCHRNPPCKLRSTMDELICNECNRSFYDQECFNHHKTVGSHSGKTRTVCQNVRICTVCDAALNSITKINKHQCFKYRCSICNKDESIDHLCHMAPRKTKKKDTKLQTAFIFFDFETRQDEKLEENNSVNVHIPTLCVAQTVCDLCAEKNDDDISKIDLSLKSPCKLCKEREKVFKGSNLVSEFVDYVRSVEKTYKQIICIAHNAKGYDSQFILADVRKRISDEVDMIVTGTSIIKMKLGPKIVFIDSLNYLHMPLASLPKAFGLGDIAKGYFPHFFNNLDNQKYSGPIPDKKFYGADTMNVQDRKKFLEWYDNCIRENYVFDFQKEILHYCRLDVTILRKACIEFRKLILESGKVCPFSECTTIASTCMTIYKTNFLENGQIGIIPQGGYRLPKNQSRCAIEWLLWREHCEQHPIIHAGRGREHRVKSGHRVDGYWEDVRNDKKYVYQFHGCYWHGCKRCFPFKRNEAANTGVKDTLENRYERTELVTRKLRGQRYEIIEMWECDFILEKKRNPALVEFLGEIDQQIFIPLDPRNAFFGGRTGNTVTHYDVKNNEKIRYVDVCSLYPYVLKTGIFPVGHPEVHVGADCLQICPNNDIAQIEGIIKCRVLPPQQLCHPVLPVKGHGKLLFPLCRSCAKDLIQTNCPHNDPRDRQLLGTWAAPELRKAIEMGYKIIELVEIWEYKETTQYNPDTKEGGLFAGYIDTFLKIKQEASGWPAECTDDASKDRYIAEYEVKEGIKLDKDKIEKNPGLRAVAKLCLNCLWGKFGQRSNLGQKSLIRNYEEFAKLMFNPEIEVTGLVPIDQETLFLTWKNLTETTSQSPSTNVVIAAYTTAHARLKLYSYLEKMQERVLYYDTDSVIYVSDGTYDLPLGNFLGDLTDEVEPYGVGSYIKTFVSGGPKFYSYRVVKPDGTIAEISKIKGVRLNYEARQKIDYDSIRALVVENIDPIKLEYDTIRRDPKHNVITRPESKLVKATGPKRRWDDANLTATLPYGYKKIRNV